MTSPTWSGPALDGEPLLQGTGDLIHTQPFFHDILGNIHLLSLNLADFEDSVKESEWVFTNAITGAERPAIFKACKEAGEIFISTGVDKPLFTVHGTKIGVYFN